MASRLSARANEPLRTLVRIGHLERGVSSARAVDCLYRVCVYGSRQEQEGQALPCCDRAALQRHRWLRWQVRLSRKSDLGCAHLLSPHLIASAARAGDPDGCSVGAVRDVAESMAEVGGIRKGPSVVNSEQALGRRCGRRRRSSGPAPVEAMPGRNEDLVRYRVACGCAGQQQRSDDRR